MFGWFRGGTNEREKAANAIIQSFEILNIHHPNKQALLSSAANYINTHPESKLSARDGSAIAWLVKQALIEKYGEEQKKNKVHHLPDGNEVVEMSEDDDNGDLRQANPVGLVIQKLNSAEVKTSKTGWKYDDHGKTPSVKFQQIIESVIPRIKVNLNDVANRSVSGVIIGDVKTINENLKKYKRAIGAKDADIDKYNERDIIATRNGEFDNLLDSLTGIYSVALFDLKQLQCGKDTLMTLLSECLTSIKTAGTAMKEKLRDFVYGACKTTDISHFIPGENYLNKALSYKMLQLLRHINAAIIPSLLNSIYGKGSARGVGRAVGFNYNKNPERLNSQYGIESIDGTLKIKAGRPKFNGQDGSDPQILGYKAPRGRDKLALAVTSIVGIGNIGEIGNLFTPEIRRCFSALSNIQMEPTFKNLGTAFKFFVLNYAGLRANHNIGIMRFNSSKKIINLQPIKPLENGVMMILKSPCYSVANGAINEIFANFKTAQRLENAKTALQNSAAAYKQFKNETMGDFIRFAFNGNVPEHPRGEYVPPRRGGVNQAPVGQPVGQPVVVQPVIEQPIDEDTATGENEALSVTEEAPPGERNEVGPRAPRLN